MTIESLKTELGKVSTELEHEKSQTAEVRSDMKQASTYAKALEMEKSELQREADFIKDSKRKL